MKVKDLALKLKQVDQEAEIGIDLIEIQMKGYDIDLTSVTNYVTFKFVPTNESFMTIACLYCHKCECSCHVK